MTNLIFVEHKDRELAYARRLGTALTAAGFGRSRVLSMPYFLWAAYLLRPKRIFLPFFKRFSDPSTAMFPVATDAVAYCLNFEQLLGNFNRDAKRPLDSEGVVHGYWYPEFLSVLDAWGVDRERVVPLPPPEAFLVHDIDRSLVECAEAWRQRYSRIVFIPECYAWSFASDVVLEKKSANGFTLSQVVRLRDYSRQNRDQMLAELKDMVAQNPDHLFILRPHPSISVEQYAALLPGLHAAENILISKAHSAWDWVGIADVVISGWSTVTFAARHLGKATSLYLPFPLIPELDVPWVRTMPQKRSLSDCVMQSQVDDASEVSVRWKSDFTDLMAFLREREAELPAAKLGAPQPARAWFMLRELVRAGLRLVGTKWSPHRSLSVYKYDFFLPWTSK